MTTPAFDSKNFLTYLTQRPGVYQMLGEKGNILYIGKAKNLKNRVSSYFRNSGLSPKTEALVAKIADINITITHSETEALLLEQTLIKRHRPPYNIVLRDDKSYPHIFISAHKDYPILTYRRGKQKAQGTYFGPYPSSNAVKDSILVLQKTFQLRSCEDSFFKNRSRPCLQHQIKRCSAPCVKAISIEEYQETIKHAMLFLQGKSVTLMEALAEKMHKASEALNFEIAAKYRDQLQSIRQIQEQQHVISTDGSADVFAAAISPAGNCVQVLTVRDGRVLGGKTFFPTIKVELTLSHLLEAFIAQYYLGGKQRDLPPDIITNAKLENTDCLQEALQVNADKSTRILHNPRGTRARWLDLANTNAEQNLISHNANKQNIRQRFANLQQKLQLNDIPQRIECFDISHTSGEKTVASCVVFDHQGPLKSDYRKFNIEGITKGDDYAAMQQAIERRYTRLKSQEAKLPDILLIDGGKGQLRIAENILEELQIHDILIIGVAKGVTRKPGFETLFHDSGTSTIELAPDSSALHLIQHIRDEAHRFAITSHRQRRAKALNTSPLEGIPGVGPKRRRELLRFFGGLQEVKNASQHELCKVNGISAELAAKIYSALHD